jgi:hypothetical protein
MYKLPKYISEEEFNKDGIQKMLNSGEVGSNVDTSGNYNLSFDKITDESKLGNYLISIPIEKTQQKQEQISTFYNTEFEEFTTIEGVDRDDDVDNLYSDVVDRELDRIEEEQLLQAQIDELSSILDKEMERNVKFKEDASEMYTASKDLIISQRIKNGEGTAKADFGAKFPFLPLTAEQLENGRDGDVDQFPFLEQ